MRSRQQPADRDHEPQEGEDAVVDEQLERERAALQRLVHKYDLRWDHDPSEPYPVKWDIVGEGWLPLLEKLINELIALGWDRRLAQVKEKLGGLRFYIGGGTPPMFEAIRRAEARSLRTCELCGAPGRLNKARTRFGAASTQSVPARRCRSAPRRRRSASGRRSVDEPCPGGGGRLGTSWRRNRCTAAMPQIVYGRRAAPSTGQARRRDRLRAGSDPRGFDSPRSRLPVGARPSTTPRPGRSWRSSGRLSPGTPGCRSRPAATRRCFGPSPPREPCGQTTETAQVQLLGLRELPHHPPEEGRQPPEDDTRECPWQRLRQHPLHVGIREDRDEHPYGKPAGESGQDVPEPRRPVTTGGRWRRVCDGNRRGGRRSGRSTTYLKH